MSRPTSPQSVEQQILARLRKGRGSSAVTLVSARDFASVGSRRAVDVALHRLTKAGTLRRLSRGLYYVPRAHPTLGEIRPSPDAVARALAGKHRLRLQPSGAYAANLLGLSEQVPLKMVYLTDGPPRRLRIGKQEIILKRTTPKNMATAGRVSGLMIQALRYLGRRQVNQSVLRTLRRRLGQRERTEMLKDVALAPAWIAEIMRQVAAESER